MLCKDIVIFPILQISRNLFSSILQLLTEKRTKCKLLATHLVRFIFSFSYLNLIFQFSI